jgi:hypothetical protein
MTLTGVDGFLTTSLRSPEVTNFITVSAAFEVGVPCLVPVNRALRGGSKRSTIKEIG